MLLRGCLVQKNGIWKWSMISKSQWNGTIRSWKESVFDTTGSAIFQTGIWGINLLFFVCFTVQPRPMRATKATLQPKNDFANTTWRLLFGWSKKYMLLILSSFTTRFDYGLISHHTQHLKKWSKNKQKQKQILLKVQY